MKIIKTNKFAQYFNKYRRDDFSKYKSQGEAVDLTPVDDITASYLAKRIIGGEGYAQVLQGVNPKLIELVDKKIKDNK